MFILSPRPEGVEEEQEVVGRRLGLYECKLRFADQAKFRRKILANPLLLCPPPACRLVPLYPTSTSRDHDYGVPFASST